MTTLEQISVKDIIKESLQKGITYESYRDLVRDLAEKGSTTGYEKTKH